MPQFQMNTLGPDNDFPADMQWDAIDDVAQGFFEALFFTENCTGTYACDWPDEEAQNADGAGSLDGTIPADVGYYGLDESSVRDLVAWVTEWTATHADLLEEATARDGYDRQRAGNDLLYTHAGHGTGFWDRSELDADGLGDRLTEAAGRGEVIPYYSTERQKLSVDFY